jgi:hypothetical protein
MRCWIASMMLLAAIVPAASAPLFLGELRSMPAKEVRQRCMPLWELWDGKAVLDTDEREQAAAACFFAFGSILMRVCELNGVPDRLRRS